MDQLNKLLVDFALTLNASDFNALPKPVQDKLALKVIEQKVPLDDVEAMDERLRISMETKLAGTIEIGDEETNRKKNEEMRALYFNKCKKGNTLKEKAAFIMKHNDCTTYADKMMNATFAAYAETVAQNKKDRETQFAKLSKLTELSYY